MPTDLLVEARNVRIGRDEGMGLFRGGAPPSASHDEASGSGRRVPWDTDVFAAAREAAAFTQLDFASTVPFDYVATGAQWM